MPEPEDFLAGGRGGGPLPPEPCDDPEPEPEACALDPPGRPVSCFGESLPDAAACAVETEPPVPDPLEPDAPGPLAPDGGTLVADPELVAAEDVEEDVEEVAPAAGFGPACDPGDP